MKLLKIGLVVSVVLYAVCVGMLALMRSAGWVYGLSTAEMLFGPVITIASVWVAWAIFYGLFGRKKHDA
jgi:hypothetical protein